jgi:uncharacterized protein (TIGR02266 family)
MIDYSNIPRDSRRVPLETRVQFKFDRFSGFISEYSANISPGGMFIRTSAPPAAGTALDLEFRLGDGFELIKGRGEVIWTRVEDEDPTRPAGMGIRFLELSEGSKDLIYRIVDQHILQGGTPFDVTQRPPDLTPAPPRNAVLPSLADLLGPAPPLAGSAQSTPSALPFPEPLPKAAKPVAAPQPVSAPPMFASTLGGASKHRPNRTLQWVLLAAVLLLAAGAFLLRDRLMEWTGFGKEDQTAPPARVAAEKPAVPAPATTGSPSPPAAVAPAAPVPSPTPAVAAGPPLTRLDRVTWEPAPGGTDVVLWGNGAIPASVFQRTRIEGNPPRELIKLSGIRASCPQTRLVAGTAEVLQIRLGYHPEMGTGEQHVVLDLAHPAVVITGIEPGPQRLRIHLQRR